MCLCCYAVVFIFIVSRYWQSFPNFYYLKKTRAGWDGIVSIKAEVVSKLRFSVFPLYFKESSHSRAVFIFLLEESMGRLTMKTFSTIIVATSILVAMVHGQNVSLPMQDFFGHIENPGEIVPSTNLTISFIINAAGGIWQQARVIDSIDYACRDVLPYIGSMIPEVDQTSLYWGFLCDEAVKASNDLDAFDVIGLCDTLTSMLTGLTSENETLEIHPEPSQGGDPFNILQILTNITKDLYGIDINMIINDPSTINTICTNVKENFLRPSLQDLISQFGAELMSAFLPQAAPICQDWEPFVQLSLGIIPAVSPYYPIIQEAALIASEAVGYDSRENLCLAIEQATSLQG